MTGGLVAELRCAVCGRVGGRVELVPPGALPADWRDWPADRRDLWHEFRDPARWQLLSQGIEGLNGWTGDAVDEARVRLLTAAFAQPYSYERIRTAGFYDDAGWCGECDAAYCHRHWNPSSTGYGTCPQGHGKSLDPHWWPDDE